MNLVFFIFLSIFLLFPSLAKRDHNNPQKKTTQNIVIAIDSEPKTLDPRIATDANGMRIINLIFQSLVKWDLKGEITSSVARRWKCQNKICIFNIKKDIKFSNGRKIKKEDILFSFNEYQSNKYPFFSAFEVIQSIKIKETKKEFVLTLILKEPSAKFLKADLPVLKILPREEVLNAGDNFYKNPIGSGVFKLQSKSSSHIILESRKDTNPLPHIKQVTFKIIRDDFTRFQKTLNGEIDVAQSVIPVNKINQFIKRNTSFKVIRSIGMSVTYLLINFKDPCLSQKKIRQALAFSIDIPTIIRYKLKNFAKPANSLLSSNSFFFNTNIERLPYQPNKAKQLVKESLCKDKVYSLKSSNSREVISHCQSYFETDTTRWNKNTLGKF